MKYMRKMRSTYTDGNNAANVEYDTEDPSMIVGSTYPNMAALRLAISQHVTKISLNSILLKVDLEGTWYIVQGDGHMFMVVIG